MIYLRNKSIKILHNGIPVPSLVDILNDTVTAQIEHFSCTALDNIPDTQCMFSDVKAGDWFYNTVTNLCKLGVVRGYIDEGLYKPHQEANLLEVLKVLLTVVQPNDCNRYNYTGAAAKIVEDANASLGKAFTETDLYSSNASAVKRGNVLGYLQTLLSMNIDELVSRGITNNARPEESITRAELTVLGYKAWVCKHDKFSNCSFYRPTVASNYAANYTSVSYGIGGNPFTDYQYSGGNCTNFASQSILSGLLGNSDVGAVFNARLNFNADQLLGSAGAWYFIDNDNLGFAWTLANSFYKYASDDTDSGWVNLLSGGSKYGGLHLEKITQDDVKEVLIVDAINIGDIVLADWKPAKIDTEHFDRDNVDVDHLMIVTGIGQVQSGDKTGYSKILVSDQNATTDTVPETPIPPRINATLSSVNNSYGQNVAFYVYRPVFYAECKNGIHTETGIKGMCK